MKVKAAAKVNFDLYITGTDNGLHTLDSVMASVNLYDTVSVKRARHTTVTMDGVPQGQDNTVFRAINAFQKRFKRVNVRVDIKKGIPISSGLGGSSADSAAVLYLLAKLYGGIVTPDLALMAGSDVPFMCYGGIMHVSGKGEKLRMLPFKRVNMLLVKGCDGASARDSYARYDEMTSEAKSREVPYSRENFEEYISSSHNALYEPVAAISDVAVVKQMIEQTNPSFCAMSGSGSTFFAIYKTRKERSEAKKKLLALGVPFVKKAHTIRSSLHLQ